ncbi:DUF6286 domain-containing protein [Frankia sp. EI5c]|uniref:DUF6286 domain-containing protein n=1 Tax=Frankia sp. EI5c TaxID=683316 RepID=UPI0037C0FD51
MLLGSQLGGRSRFRARPTVAGSAVFVSQRALARALRSAALSVDGIAAVSVRVRRRRAVVRPRLRARVSYGAIPQLKAALSRSLDGFDLLRPPRIVIEPTAARRRGRRRHRAVARIPAAAGAAGPPTPAAGTPRSGAMQSGWGASAARPVAGRPVAGRAVAGRAATGQPAGGQPAGGRSAGERSASGGGRSRERIRQGNAAGQEGRR